MSTKPKKRKLYLFRKFLATLLLSILIIGLVVAGFGLNMLKDMIADKPELVLEKLESPESSYVYDANGNQFAEIGSKLSDNITYEELPNDLIDAFISIEDAKFFVHDGFDLARFTNELFQTVARFLRGGGLGAGASTITMQTIKNSFFAIEDQTQAANTIDRKAQEISMAMDLEKEISKEGILVHYLNKINFGVPSSRGISKAAKYYFNKDVSQLNLSESAYLAGVINKPNPLNAYRDVEAGTARRNQVLRLMERHGYISETERIVAQNTKLENQLWGAEKWLGDQQPYQEYLDVVIQEVQDKFELDPFNSGLKIYTSLNVEQQKLIEAIESNEYGYFYDDKIDGAYISLNNQTGEIIAVGGGRHFEGEERVARGFNNATSLRRQVGSVLKPIFPYGWAFEYLGYATNHVVEDGPYVYVGTDIFVGNADGRYRGDLTITEAIERSLNIPSIRVMEDVLSNNGIGHDRAVQLLKDMGLDNEVAERLNIQYALGGADLQASPLQVAAIHAMIMNKGEYIEPHAVTKVETGTEIIEANPERRQVISEPAAYMIATELNAVVNASGGVNWPSIVNRKNYPVYIKTGTTNNDNSLEAYGIPESTGKDKWQASSTTEYTHVIWQGYNPIVEDGVGYYVDDVSEAARRVSEQMNFLLDKAAEFHTPGRIERPEGVKTITHVEGVYPYVAPASGMDSSYITESLILEKFSKLGTLETSSLSNLSGQSVEVGDFTDGKLNIKVNVNQYPDSSKLTVASPTKTMTATAFNGKSLSVTGKRAFDPSWIYGAVLYGTEIKANGEVVGTDISGESNKTLALSNISSNTNLHVCSFYTWDKNRDSRSNEVCETVNSGILSISVPDFIGKNLLEAIDWINSNTEASYQTRAIRPENADDVNKIVRITPNYSGRDNVTQEQIDAANFVIDYYDATLRNLQSFVGRRVSQLVNTVGSTFTLSGPVGDPNAIIESVTVNGQAVNEVKLSENRTITFTVKQPQPQPESTPEPGE